MTKIKNPVALVILDGFGLAPESEGNAVKLANTPTFDAICASYPAAQLSASGLDVGLPEGQMGNSEVGHLNLGAGRVVYQDLTRIDRAITDGSFRRAPELVTACENATKGRGVLHIVGLCSFGGVHSNLHHIVEVARFAASIGVREIRVHAITDGRDVSPDASLNDIPWLERQLDDFEAEYEGCRARIVSVVGRYWAMDRDKRWDRTQRAWDLMVLRKADRASSANDAVRRSHAAGVTDEFIEPWAIALDDTTSGDGIDSSDVVIFANFRPDRMRQLVPAIASYDFAGFDRGRTYRPARSALCLCEYDAELNLPVAFPSETITNTLADILEENKVGQLHVAETEKYPHVTYFFNGGVEKLHRGEDRKLAPSPRDVPTYDLKPEMSAKQVAELFSQGFLDEEVGFGIVNFANPDMVGHTGVISAAVKACEAADKGLSTVLDAVKKRGGYCIVTADHGNAETMLTVEGNPHTAHTTNPVPIVLVSYATDNTESILLNDGKLADIAPTILDLLGLTQPSEMTGSSLIRKS